MDACLTKPIEPVRLLEAIEDLVPTKGWQPKSEAPKQDLKVVPPSALRKPR